MQEATVQNWLFTILGGCIYTVPSLNLFMFSIMSHTTTIPQRNLLTIPPDLKDPLVF
jgi:hypothetical protein